MRGGLEGAAAARRALLGANGTLPEAVRDDVLLLVTELVANAVVHAGVGPRRSVSVEVRRSAGRLRVEVVDPGAGFQHAPRARAHGDAGGWGLVLVERIADRWGITRRPGATCVWFEIRSHA